MRLPSPDDSPWSGFTSGARLPAFGARWLLHHSEVWALVAVPIGLQAGLTLGVLWLCFVVAPGWFADVLPPPDGALFLMWLVPVVIFVIALLALGLVALYLVSGLVLLPFLDALSRQVEAIEHGRSFHDEGWGRFLLDLLQSALHTVLAASLYLLANVLLLAVDLVPVLGELLHAAVGSALGALLLARELLDAPLARRRFGFADKLRVVWKDRWFWGGAGATTGLLLAVPFLNLIAWPAAVVGATWAYSHLERSKGE